MEIEHIYLWLKEINERHSPFDVSKWISPSRRKEMQEEIDLLKSALTEIAKTCPLLSANKDKMYTEESSSLFLRSTVRRMELARKALDKYKQD